MLMKAAIGFLVVDGRRIMQTVSYGFDAEQMWIEEYGLDEAGAAEFSPGTRRVFGEIGLVRVVGDGGPEGYGLGAPILLAPRQRYQTLEIVERQSGLAILSCQGKVVFGKQSWRSAVKGLQQGTMTFRADGWVTEV